jgi:hypothetical protein
MSSIEDAITPARLCALLEEADHQLSLEEWAALLLETFPREHREPPLPGEPTIIFSKRQMIAVLAERCWRFGRRFSEQLFHPEDRHYRGPISVVARRRRNGRTVSAELLAAGVMPERRPTSPRPSPADPPAWSAYEDYRRRVRSIDSKLRHVDELLRDVKRRAQAEAPAEDVVA